MNRYEFITQLDQYLKGNVSEQEREESIRYYREYIESEILSGKTEDEVLEELGSPNSIGKSIVDAKGISSEIYGENDEYQDYGYDRQEAGQTAGVRQIRLEGWKSWFIIGGILLLILLILSLMFRIFAFMVPFLLPCAVILLVLKVFGGRR